MPQQTQEIANGFRWVDIVNPSDDELHLLANTYALPNTLLQDCLDPIHLPKFEEVDGAQFVIVRVFDTTSNSDASTVRELTRKLAVFLRGETLFTIHRAPLAFVEPVFIKASQQRQKAPLDDLLVKLLKKAVLTYEQPLQDIEERLEKLGATSHSTTPHHERFSELHFIRNRLSTFKRLFWHTQTSVQRMPAHQGELKRLVQDLIETIEGLLFFSDELLEETTSLISLELAIASERTNHVIRILTIFSVFFMPLTFIVGIYGMNFQHLPEIAWRYGYSYVWGLMVLVTLAIAFWFRSKKWL